MNTITANQMIYKEDLSAKAKAVFQYLAFRSNKENTCFPALKTIAKECAMSVSSVQRGLRELLDGGFIRKKHNFRANGSQTSNIYEVIANVEERARAAKENLQQRIRELRRRAALREEKEQQTKMNLEEPKPSLRRDRHEWLLLVKKALDPFLPQGLTRGAGQSDHPGTMTD